MTPIKSQAPRDSVLTTLTNYLIVSGMLTCAAIGLVQVGQQVAPRWNASFVPVLVFFIALESAYHDALRALSQTAGAVVCAARR